MRPHLPEEELHAYCDGAMSPEQRAEASRHLLRCLICRSAHAEVVSLRERTAALLARAVPAGQRSAAPPITATASTSRPWRRRGPMIAAAIATVLGTATLVDAFRDEAQHGTGADWRQAATIPAIFRHRPAAAPAPSAHDVWSITDRSLAIVATFHPTPTTTGATPPRRLPTVRPRTAMVEPRIEPDLTAGWETLDPASAGPSDRGVLLAGAGLTLVTLHTLASDDGARASTLGHYHFPDGRSLWIAEGEEEKMEPVQELLERHGLTLSVTRRTRPDYLVTDQGTERTIRHAVVAGVLTADSLNVLVERLALGN